MPTLSGSWPRAACVQSERTSAVAMARCRRSIGVLLEHDPEKACPGLDPGWTPVFGKDHAQKHNLERGDDAKKRHPARGTMLPTMLLETSAGARAFPGLKRRSACGRCCPR